MSLIGEESFSQLIGWVKAQVKNLVKKKKIAKLIDQTAMRAPMVASYVDLGAKFKDPRLIQELLAHHSLCDIGKDEAIRTFLGEGFDGPAYEYVASFWDSISVIASTGEESLVARKAVEEAEIANRKLDALAEAVGIAPEDSESLRRRLADYCSVFAQRYNEATIPRRIAIKGSKELLPQSALLEREHSVLVYADPGMGKSKLMAFVAASLAKAWVDGKGNRVPVLLEAREWSRRYSSLAEGAAKEVFGYAIEASMSFIRDNPELFCLIVDGLDETRNDRDLLFSELECYARFEKSRLVCSSRFKNDSERIGINSASLQGLTEEEVVSYLSDKGVNSPWSVLRRFNKAGRELMRNPLHLRCLVEYLRTEGDGSAPRNLATIYGTCIASMIEAKVDPDGGLDADYLQQRLGSYALECLVEREVPACRSFLLERCEPIEAERIERAGKDSGLLIAIGGAIEISHAVFQEYLAAIFLASRQNDEIKAFCELHARNPLLKNFFKILCGLTANAEKQTLVLDCLENRNLALFMACLRERMNLSDEIEGRLSKDDIAAIARQAFATYINISNRYLRKAKPHIPFWKTLSSPDASIRMEASYSVATTVMCIALKECQPGEDSVVVELSDDKQGPVMIGSNGSAVPISSIRVSNRPETHIYRIGAVYEGIDCAREMAISMINDDLGGFFDSAEPILSEPLGMKIAFTEEALWRSRIWHKDEEGRQRHISLRNCTADGLARTLAGKPERNINVGGTDIPVGLLPLLVRMLELAPADHLQYLPPVPNYPGEGCHRVWEAYTDEAFESWCRVVLPECEKSYRQFIRTFMEEVGEYLPAYADGPFALKAIVEPADESAILPDRYLRVSQFPVESEEETRLEFVDDFFPKDFSYAGFEERAQDYIQAAKLLGRPGNSYHESTFRGSALLTERIFIHNEVRKRIKKDVEALFKLR